MIRKTAFHGLLAGGLIAVVGTLSVREQIDRVRVEAAADAARAALVAYRATGSVPGEWTIRHVSSTPDEDVSIAFGAARIAPANVARLDPLGLTRIGHYEVGVVDEKGVIRGAYNAWMLQTERVDLNADALPPGTVVLLLREGRPFFEQSRPPRAARSFDL